MKFDFEELARESFQREDEISTQCVEAVKQQLEGSQLKKNRKCINKLAKVVAILAVCILTIGTVASASGTFFAGFSGIKELQEKQDKLEKLQDRKEMLENTEMDNAKKASQKEEELKELTEEIAQKEIDLGVYDYRADIETMLDTIHAVAKDNERAATFYDEEKAKKIQLHCKKLYGLEEKYRKLLKKAKEEDLAQMAEALEQELNEVNTVYHNY